MPVGAPAASGASSLMKSCHASVGMPKPTAVYALSCATCTLRSAAPSMRLNALSTPLSSTTAITNGMPISAAFASAAATIRCARSVLMLGFWNVSPIVLALSGEEALLELADLGEAEEVEHRGERREPVEDRQGRARL